MTSSKQDNREKIVIIGDSVTPPVVISDKVIKEIVDEKDSKG